MRLWLRKAVLDLGWTRVGRGPGIGGSRSAVCIEVLSIDEGVVTKVGGAQVPHRPGGFPWQWLAQLGFEQAGG